ncbi:hypothetical protein [Alteromonas sp. S167]|uniref:hypothetical protein n=1 Tax=Alteromonas sp. S167 TaxID=3117402 RepID=UPI002FE26FDE
MTQFFINAFYKSQDLFFDFYRVTEMYRNVISTCWHTLIEIISSAKFVFFSIVAIGIGAMGIWVPAVFSLDLSGSATGALQSQSKIENFSMFMYVVSVLGTLAAEYLIKNEKLDDEKKEAVQSFSMFIWFVAIVLAFWALKEPKENTWQLWLSLWLAISLWMSFTIKKDDFKYSCRTKNKLEGIDINNSKFGGNGL